jgi:hypothetical protein
VIYIETEIATLIISVCMLVIAAIMMVLKIIEVARSK